MNARMFIGLLAIVILSTPALAQDCPAKLTRYTISNAGNGSAHVRINHTLASEWVNIAFYTARDGRTTESFITNATIASPRGATKLEADGGGAYSTSSARIGDQVVIEYDVSLDYADHVWPHGHEEIGVALGDGAYLVSRVAMMADYGAPDCRIEVEFQTSDSAAPWTPVSKNIWRAENLSAFHNNAFAFGNGFGRFFAETSEGRVTFIHDAASTAFAKQAAMDIGLAIAHTTEIFGEFPPNNYHIFLFENNHPEGAAFEGSFAMLHPVPAQPIDAEIWRQGLIHEINHLWLGRQVRPAPGADIEWFKEGFSDYLAIKTMWQLGYIDTAQLEDKLENLMRRHTLGVFMSQGKVALTEAGANKSQNMMIIYGSGATLAFMLDVEMAAKQGPGAFEDMLADLYAHSDEDYTSARLIQRLNAASHGAAGRLLAQFDKGLMPMAFPAMLEPYGMELAFMIPDLFGLDLTPRDCGDTICLPAFLQNVD